MATEAGLLSVKITAEDKAFIEALARSRAALKATNKEFDAGIDTIKRYGAQFLALATTGGLAMYLKATADTIDAQAKMARQMGGTTAAVQALTRAGDLAGVSQEDLGKAAAGLNVRLGQALEGSGKAVGALAALKLNAEDLAKLDADARFAKIADAIDAQGISAQQTGNIMRELGIKQASIISLFEGGGDSIRNARKEVEQFGVATSEVEAAKIEAANDAMTSLGLTAKGVATRVVVELAPVFTALGEKIHQDGQEMGGLRDTILNTAESTAKGFGYFLNVLHGVDVALNVFGVGVLQLQSDLQTVFAIAARTIAQQFDLAVAAMNLVIKGINKIPKVHVDEFILPSQSDTFKGIRDSALLAQARTKIAVEDLQKKMMEPLPTQNVEKWFADVREKADAAAKATVAARKNKPGDDFNIVDTADPAEAAKKHRKALEEISSMRTGALSGEAKALAELQDKYRKLNDILLENPELQKEGADAAAALAQQYQIGVDAQIAAGVRANAAFLDDINVRREAQELAHADEFTRLEKKYADEQELLEQSLLNQQITIEKYNADMAALQRDHDTETGALRIKNWSDLDKVHKLSWKGQAEVLTGSLADMSSTLANKSRFMFEVNKRAAEGNVILKGIESVQAAFSWGMTAGGPWLAAAAAVAAGAYSALQFAAIESTQFGGGAKSTTAGVPSAAIGSAGGGSTGAEASPVPTQQRLVVEGIDPGKLYSGSMLAGLVEQLQQFQKDGGQLVVSR